MATQLKHYLLALLLIFTAQSIQAIAETSLAPEDQERMIKLNAIFMGCELEESCMLNVLSEVTKSDPSPIYQTVLSSLKSQQDLIAFNAANCNHTDIRLLKTEVATCLSSIVNVFQETSTASLTDKLKLQVNSVNSCIQNKMSALALKNNFFAMNMLINYANQTGDKSQVDYWNSVMKTQANSAPEQYDVYQRCAQTLQLVPKGLDAKSLAQGNVGGKVG